MGSDLSGGAGRREVRGVGDRDDSGAVAASRQCGGPDRRGVDRARPTGVQAGGLHVQGCEGSDAGRGGGPCARRTGGRRNARVPALRSPFGRARHTGHDRPVPAHRRPVYTGADRAGRAAVARLSGTVGRRAQSGAGAGVVHAEARPRVGVRRSAAARRHRAALSDGLRGPGTARGGGAERGTQHPRREALGHGSTVSHARGRGRHGDAHVHRAGGIVTIQLLHLADLHFGGQADIRKIEALEKMIPDLRPDVTVIAGDLSQRARHGELQRARAFANLAAETAPVHVIPGNHDVQWWTRPLIPFAKDALYRKYVHYFGADLTPTLTVRGAVIAGALTSHGVAWGSLTLRVRDLAVKGHLPKREAARVKQVFAAAAPEQARILVLHHNVLRGEISRRMGLARWRRAQRRIVETGAA